VKKLKKIVKSFRQVTEKAEIARQSRIPVAGRASRRATIKRKRQDREKTKNGGGRLGILEALSRESGSRKNAVASEVGSKKKTVERIGTLGRRGKSIKKRSAQSLWTRSNAGPMRRGSVAKTKDWNRLAYLPWGVGKKTRGC